MMSQKLKIKKNCNERHSNTIKRKQMEYTSIKLNTSIRKKENTKKRENEKFLHRTATACDSNKSASCERCRCSKMMLWFGCFFSKMRKPFDNAILLYKNSQTQ